DPRLLSRRPYRPGRSPAPAGVVTRATRLVLVPGRLRSAADAAPPRYAEGPVVPGRLRASGHVPRVAFAVEGERRPVFAAGFRVSLLGRRAGFHSTRGLPWRCRSALVPGRPDGGTPASSGLPGGLDDAPAPGGAAADRRGAGRGCGSA